MIRPPPISPLFPSTPLFRSLLPFDDIAHLSPFAEELCPPHFVHRIVGVLDDVELVVYDAAPRSPLLNTQPERLPHVHASRLDRKSTRLNSSHLVISYAVFCL